MPVESIRESRPVDHERKGERTAGRTEHRDHAEHGDHALNRGDSFHREPVEHHERPEHHEPRDVDRPHHWDRPLPPPPPPYPFPPSDPFCRPGYPGYPYCPPQQPYYPPPGSSEPIVIHGSAGANIQVMYNSRLGKAEVMPQVKGDIDLFSIGEKSSIGVGLALAGNGSTNVFTGTVVGKINDRFSVELGASHISDGESSGALHAGVNYSPIKYLNVSAGTESNGHGVNPYLGVGGKISF